MRRSSTSAPRTRYRETVPYLLLISRQTVGDENIRARIARFSPEFYPEESADELRFLVGHCFYASGSYDDALARFQLVSEKDGDFFVRARYLEGVIHVPASRAGRRSGGRRLLSPRRSRQGPQVRVALPPR